MLIQARQLNSTVVKNVVVVGILVSVFSIIYMQNSLSPINGSYGHVPRDWLPECSLVEIPSLRAPMEKWFLCASTKLFGNENILSFIFSVSLIPLTFVFSRKITKNDNAALFASGLLLLSPIIGYLGTTAALTTDWVFFLFLSMYMGYKRPETSGVFYFIAITCKGLSLLLLPTILYFIYKSDMPNKKRVAISYIIVSGIVVGIWFSGDSNIIQQDGQRWQPEKALIGLDNMVHVFRSDWAQYVIIPASFAVTFFTKNPLGRPIFAMMGLFYSLVVLFPIFSIYIMYDYRMIPLIIFGAIGVSMAIPRRKNAGH